MKRFSENKGITLVELLLVISLGAILSAASVPIASSFLIRSNLRDSKDKLVSQLYKAKINSMTNKENSSWGVSTTGNDIIVFKGSSYATRDSAFDQAFNHPNSINITSHEIIFTQYTGDTTQTTYSISNNQNETFTVSVNQVGNINVN